MQQDHRAHPEEKSGLLRELMRTEPALLHAQQPGGLVTKVSGTWRLTVNQQGLQTEWVLKRRQAIIVVAEKSLPALALSRQRQPLLMPLPVSPGKTCNAPLQLPQGLWHLLYQREPLLVS